MIEELGSNILNFSIVDFIDIVLVAIIIYQIYKLIRGTIAINIFLGFLLIYLLWIVVKAFNMQLLSTILDKFLGVGIIAVFVLFQQEIRKFLLLLGRNTSVSNSYFKKLFRTNTNNLTTQESVKALSDAIIELSGNKVGALIVFINGYDEETFQNNGEWIDAEISKRLIESLFMKNSPLHDGAVIVSNLKIKCAGAILPLSDSLKLPAQMGLRHRAAVGIAEQGDNHAIVVSEETGKISYAKRGRIDNINSPKALENILREILN